MVADITLKDIIGHLDGYSKANLYVGTENVWSGDLYLIQAAADIHGDKKQFLEECLEDEAYKIIIKVLNAERFLNYILDTDLDAEAIGIDTYTNPYGVKTPVFQICLKEK